MARALSWFQARAIAQLEGRPIRRTSWRRWLTFRKSVFLWFTWSPGDSTVSPALPPIAARVCTNEDHTDADFLAYDWTDEGWTASGDGGEPPGDPKTGGNTGSGSTGTGTGSTGSTGGTGTGTGTGTGPGTKPGSGGGWGGAGNGPGPGGNSDPGPGGGGGSSGGGGGGTPPTTPTTPTPNPGADGIDYTPTVGVSKDPGLIDGPGCYIQAPAKGHAYVTVEAPNPPKGRAPVLTVSVSCLGQTKLGTIAPGASQSFEFEGPINPGGPIVATATLSDGAGHTGTGQGTATWPPACMVVPAEWTGTKTETFRSPAGVNAHLGDKPAPSTPTETGYDQTDTYTIKGTYAVNPDEGTNKTGQLLPAKFGQGNGGIVDETWNYETVYTDIPDGQPQTSHSYSAPPNSITVDVDASHHASNIQPQTLGIFPHGSTTTTDEHGCTLTIDGSESGPS